MIQVIDVTSGGAREDKTGSRLVEGRAFNMMADAVILNDGKMVMNG